MFSMSAMFPGVLTVVVGTKSLWYRNPKHRLAPVLLLTIVSTAITAYIVPRPMMSAQTIYGSEQESVKTPDFRGFDDRDAIG